MKWAWDVDVDEERSHLSVNWADYFRLIRTECPWGYRAYQQGKIDIQKWQGHVIPLGSFMARVYVSDSSYGVEQLAQALDYGEDEWLFSYPGYGEFATPVPVLIQQNRQTLAEIRSKLASSSK